MALLLVPTLASLLPLVLNLFPDSNGYFNFPVFRSQPSSSFFLLSPPPNAVPNLIPLPFFCLFWTLYVSLFQSLCPTYISSSSLLYLCHASPGYKVQRVLRCGKSGEPSRVKFNLFVCLVSQPPNPPPHPPPPLCSALRERERESALKGALCDYPDISHASERLHNGDYKSLDSSQ